MSTKIDENTTLLPAETRDAATGRFQPGGPGGPGRPRNALTAALRRIVEPEKIAAFVYGILTDDRGRYGTGDRQWAAKFIFDRLEGKPTQAVSMNVSATVDDGLPDEWDSLSSNERASYIDSVRQRALAAGAR